MSTQSKYMLILTVPCIFLSSCARMHPAGVNNNLDSYLERGRIQFEKTSMGALIEVERVDPQRMGRGLLNLIVTLRNKTKKDLWIECRTTFLDKNNHMLERTNWEPIRLDARTSSEYRCTSLSELATDYQLIMRKPAKSSLEMP